MADKKRNVMLSRRGSVTVPKVDRSHEHREVVPPADPPRQCPLRGNNCSPMCEWYVPEHKTCAVLGIYKMMWKLHSLADTSGK
jgi:hypothetical protein